MGVGIQMTKQDARWAEKGQGAHVTLQTAHYIIIACIRQRHCPNKLAARFGAPP